MRDDTEALDRALAFGVLALESGASTTLAERAFQCVLRGAGIADGFAVWRLDFAAAGRTSDDGAGIVRPVGRIGENFRRLAAIARLADRAVRHQADPGEVSRELNRIRHLDSPYAAWMMMAATACTAGLFVELQNADWRSVALALVAAAVGQALWFPLGARRMSPNGRTLACATASALAAAVGLRLHVADAPAVLVGSIIYLVPGLALVNGFVDLASHQHLIIGVQRIASAGLQCALLAVAVTLAVTIAW